MKVGRRKALAALARVVKRYGPETDYADRDCFLDEDSGESAFSSCRYTDEDGTPLCLIGAVLIEEFGARPADFRTSHKHLAEPSRNYADIWDLLRVTGFTIDGITFTDEAVRVFEVAQSEQDEGALWGEALWVARYSVTS